MPLKCKACDQHLTKTQGSVLCKSCDCWIHSDCADIDGKKLSLLKAVKSFVFICSECEPSIGKRNSNDGVIEKINGLAEKLDNFMANYQAEQNRLTMVLDDIKKEVSSCVAEMRSDIKECNENVRRIEVSSTAKFVNLEKEDNVLHRRMNRSDILIGGLPEGLEDLEAPVFALGSFYKVPIESVDINHVCYINRKKQILVKFNKVSKRDELMKEYYKTRSLKVSDILGAQVNGLSSRVYLNDHFSPAAAHLNFVCKKLRRLKVVTKFKILNSDNLRAWLRFSDGREDTCSTSQCDALLLDAEGRSN